MSPDELLISITEHHRQVFILTRVARDWCIYASISARTLVGPQRFNSARFVLPPHLSAIVGLPARPNELQTRQTFDVCWKRMPQCTCFDGSFCPHFAGVRAKGKRSFRTGWPRLVFFFRTLGVPISDLTTDLSDIPTDLWLKPPARFAWRVRWTMKHDGFRTTCVLQTRNTKHTYTIWKLEQDLKQVPQPVRTSGGGLAKLGSSKIMKIENAFPCSTLLSPSVAVFIFETWRGNRDLQAMLAIFEFLFRFQDMALNIFKFAKLGVFFF